MSIAGNWYLWSTYAGTVVSFNNSLSASPVLTLPGHVYGSVLCGLQKLGGVRSVKVRKDFAEVRRRDRKFESLTKAITAVRKGECWVLSRGAGGRARWRGGAQFNFVAGFSLTATSTSELSSQTSILVVCSDCAIMQLPIE